MTRKRSGRALYEGRKGEFGLISKFVAGQPDKPGVVVGPGDDASAVSVSAFKAGVILQTTDLLVENVHFRKGWGTPYQLGWKSLAVSLSDIAAMGGRPLQTHLSLAIPPSWSESEILEFRKGFFDLADQYDMALLGGDLSRSEGSLMISVSVNGEASPQRVLRREGAQPGDKIWVSGTLGDAAAGLRLLREVIEGRFSRELLDAFLQPHPEVELGMICSASMAVNALIDLSDGLAGDLGHVLEASDCGALIQEKNLPLSKTLPRVVEKHGWRLLELILKGGEDYRLLGCTPVSKFDDFGRMVEDRLGRTIFTIGAIEEKPGLRLQRRDGRIEDVPAEAYDHFA